MCFLCSLSLERAVWAAHWQCASEDVISESSSGASMVCLRRINNRVEGVVHILPHRFPALYVDSFSWSPPELKPLDASNICTEIALHKQLQRRDTLKLHKAQRNRIACVDLTCSEIQDLTWLCTFCLLKVNVLH